MSWCWLRIPPARFHSMPSFKVLCTGWNSSPALSFVESCPARPRLSFPAVVAAARVRPSRGRGEAFYSCRHSCGLLWSCVRTKLDRYPNVSYLFHREAKTHFSAYLLQSRSWNLAPQHLQYCHRKAWREYYHSSSKSWSSSLSRECSSHWHHQRSHSCQSRRS